MYALMTPRQFNGVIFLDQSPLFKCSCKILSVLQLADPTLQRRRKSKKRKSVDGWLICHLLNFVIHYGGLNAAEDCK